MYKKRKVAKKMLDSKWGIRLISLVLAIFLFLSVNDVFGSYFGQEQFNQNEETVLENVPVETIYDKENLYLSGAPKMVSIRISGPHSIVKKTESMLDFNVKLDLSNSVMGEHNKAFIVDGLSDKLKYDVMPKSANVTLSEKISATKQVEAEISNSRIANGFELIGEEVDPSQVVITGGAEEIQKIAYVKATQDNKTKLTTSTSEIAEVNVFDSQLNKLDVTVQPEQVKVNIKIQETSKTVPITVKTMGAVASGYALEDVTLSDSEVELFGNRTVLDAISDIELTVDISDLTKDTELKQDISLPNDVTKVLPKETTVKLKITKK